MVNDHHGGRRLPSEGTAAPIRCCEMCKGRLANDPSSRVSADPVSGKTVDKATAVIGRDSEGRTLYFENDLTFAAHARRTSR